MSLRRRGFSLIDVIVGVALMLLLFSALFGILARHEVSARNESHCSRGRKYAMEYLRGLSTTRSAL